MQADNGNTVMYMATSEVANILLTLPPAMLRNDAPGHLASNRKIKYTAVKVDSIIAPGPARMHHTLTYVWHNRHREQKHEEKARQNMVDSTVPIDF